MFSGAVVTVAAFSSRRSTFGTDAAISPPDEYSAATDRGIGPTTLRDPWDASPNFRDRGDQVYLVPSNFWQLAVIFAGHCGKITVLAQLKGMRKEEYGRECVKHGWNNNGRRGRDGGGKTRE